MLTIVAFEQGEVRTAARRDPAHRRIAGPVGSLPGAVELD